MRGKYYPCKSYVEGELFYFLGKPYPLRLKPQRGALPSLLLGDQELCLEGELPKDPFPLFLSWYTDHTLRLVQEVLPLCCKLLSVRPKSIEVRFANSRWGSCTSKGRILFNSRLATTPQKLIEYVVVHELCHLLQMNHSRAFWQEVERVLPDWKQRRADLKSRGAQTAF